MGWHICGQVLCECTEAPLEGSVPSCPDVALGSNPGRWWQIHGRLLGPSAFVSTWHVPGPGCAAGLQPEAQPDLTELTLLWGHVEETRRLP